MEVIVHAGDLVGVIQKKDPMGDGNRWYVDNGVVQGFVPSRVLAAIGDHQVEETQQFSKNLQTDSNGVKSFSSKGQLSTADHLDDKSNTKLNVFHNINNLKEGDEITTTTNDPVSYTHLTLPTKA